MPNDLVTPVELIHFAKMFGDILSHLKHLSKNEIADTLPAPSSSHKANMLQIWFESVGSITTYTLNPQARPDGQLDEAHT